MAPVEIGTTDAPCSFSGLVPAMIGKAVSRCPEAEKGGRVKDVQWRECEHEVVRLETVREWREHVDKYQILLARTLSLSGGLHPFLA